MKYYTRRTGLERCTAVTLACLIGSAPLPAIAEEPFAGETAEMREARKLLDEAKRLEKTRPNQANFKRRQAIEQLELAWENRQDPIALFRSALIFARVFERPVAAAQAADRYLTAMEFRGMDVAHPDAKSRKAVAEQLVQAGREAARDARPEPDPKTACEQATIRPSEGRLRVDDPVNGRFLLIRETGRGEVFVANCDVEGVIESQDDAPWTLFWSGVGAVVVGAGLAVVGFGIVSDSAEIRLADDICRSRDHSTCDGLVDSVQDSDIGASFYVGGLVIAGAGLAAVIGGAIWAQSQDEPAPLEVGIGPGTLSIMGRF